MIRSIVFDFGAVLFTWQPVAIVRQHFGHLTPTAEAAHELAHAMFAHEDWLGFDRGVHELHVVVERMAARLDLPAERLRDVLAPIGERLTPIPETVALLRRLAAARDADALAPRLYYLSNMPEPYARVLEQRQDFLACFDGGIFSGDVKLAKPDRAIYERLAERHRLTPHETLFIDDMPANIEAARALGWHTIHCTDASAVPAQVDAFLQA